MFKESESMRRIHRIRERMYEETRGMTVKEYLDYVHKAALHADKKYGLKLKKRAKAH